MDKRIKITIDNKEYTARLNQNRCVEDILSMLPLTLRLQRYAGHEYYGTLAQKPGIKGVPIRGQRTKSEQKNARGYTQSKQIQRHNQKASIIGC